MLRIIFRCTRAGVLQAAVISIDVQAGDADRARQQGARPKRILVGHSLGGACAVAEVIDHPEVCSHAHTQEPVEHKMLALTDADSAAAWQQPLASTTVQLKFSPCVHVCCCTQKTLPLHHRGRELHAGPCGA